MTQQKGYERRKLSNMLIDPRLQLLLFLPYVVVLIGFVTTNLLVVRGVITSFGTIALDPTTDQMGSLNAIYHNLMIVSTAGLIGAATAGFVLVIMVSHRLLGPLHNIQTHVRRLRSGEYEHKIILRKGDRLVQLADDLNEVTASLRGLSTPSR